jgi:hypothetical protein
MRLISIIPDALSVGTRRFVVTKLSQFFLSIPHHELQESWWLLLTGSVEIERECRRKKFLREQHTNEQSEKTFYFNYEFLFSTWISRHHANRAKTTP